MFGARMYEDWVKPQRPMSAEVIPLENVVAPMIGKHCLQTWFGLRSIRALRFIRIVVAEQLIPQWLSCMRHGARHHAHPTAEFIKWTLGHCAAPSTGSITATCTEPLGAAPHQLPAIITDHLPTKPAWSALTSAHSIQQRHIGQRSQHNFYMRCGPGR